MARQGAQSSATVGTEGQLQQEVGVPDQMLSSLLEEIDDGLKRGLSFASSPSPMQR